MSFPPIYPPPMFVVGQPTYGPYFVGGVGAPTPTFVAPTPTYGLPTYGPSTYGSPSYGPPTYGPPGGQYGPNIFMTQQQQHI